MSLVDVGAIIDDHEADDSDVAIAATSAATAAAMPSDTGARLPDNTEVELEFETFGEGDYAESLSERMPLTSGAVEPGGKASTLHCWNVAYYQPYFNVDTEDVAMRLTCAVKAYQGKTLFDTHHDADLYGPFWISVTLALTLFVVSNLASFMSHPASGPEWMYDFSLLASGFSVILGYFVGASAILWASLRWRSLPGKLTDLVCIYGYSATIWVPMAVVCTVPSELVRWAAVLLCFAYSTYFLIMSVVSDSSDCP